MHWTGRWVWESSRGMQQVQFKTKWPINSGIPRSQINTKVWYQRKHLQWNNSIVLVLKACGVVVMDSVENNIIGSVFFGFDIILSKLEILCDEGKQVNILCHSMRFHTYCTYPVLFSDGLWGLFLCTKLPITSVWSETDNLPDTFAKTHTMVI